MKYKVQMSCLLGSLFVCPLVAQAGTIVAPDSVSASIPDLNPAWAIEKAYAIENLINQTGISANYTSGVTDFDAFVASTTLTNSPSIGVGIGAGTGWASTAGNIFPASIDFFFSTSLNLSRLVVWNDTDIQALGKFEVFSSTDSLFSSLTPLGSFSGLVQTVGTFGQVFDFTDANTQYLRISGSPLDSVGGFGLLNIGEFAFEDSSAAPAPVPIPATALLLLASMGGLGLVSRRRRSAA